MDASSSSRLPVLDVVGVRQSYPRADRTQQVVLSDIDLRVDKPQFISVVGPSGCGKSTLLRLVLGSERPTHGTIRCDGKLVDHPGRDRGIVFQKYSLFPHLTVLENVMLGLELDQTWLLEGWFSKPSTRREAKAKRRAHALAGLEEVGLDPHCDKYPHQLSGGMQQRVAIAQATVMRPKILLMDEPFGALDPGTRETLQDFIVDTARQFELTVFFVTHDLEEALHVSERIIVLSPFWKAQDGQEPQGARIVMDLPVRQRHLVAANGEELDLEASIREIRSFGFDPDNLQYTHEFQHRAQPAQA